MEQVKIGKLGLYATLILTVAVVVLMGIALTNQFSYTLRDSTVTTIDGLNLSSVNATVNIGTAGQYPFLQGLTGCYNETGNTSVADDLLSTSFYTVAEGTSNGGSISLNDAGAAWADVGVNCTSLTYLADSTEQAQADKFSTGLAVFATFMGVIIIALLGKIIISIFKEKGEME